MDNNINSRITRRKQAEVEHKSSSEKNPKKKKGLIKTLIKIVVVVGLLFLLAGGGLFAYYASTAPKLDESLLKDPISSNFLNANEEVIYSTGDEKRNSVAYEDIPKEMEDAILATEDSRFYKHHGIDIWRLGGAVLANLKSGFGSQGASTLTQQVIKNSFLTNEKTLKRKAQEAWLSFKLEREYTKEEIFEMYFNKVLMSGNQYGFGTGANYFFGKELKDLELPEIAMLAGMPQSPNAYNPFKHPKRATKRRDVVLRLMNQHEKITAEEMETAKAVPVTAALLPEEQRQKSINLESQAYIDLVMNELQERGYEDSLKDGITVHTSLDPEAQQVVEKALADPSNFESDTIQAGMTVVDTKTGEIVAVGGGRDYKLYNYNFATDQKRQPGSSIKPILDYGPAIEHLNWSTGQTIVDEETKGIKAGNVDGRYKGAITMREALYNSRNVPAIKTFQKVGSKNAANFAQGLGLSIEELDQSDAIGGSQNEFSTKQMAGAFAAFGNEGIYNTPHTINKIVLRDGETEINLAPDPVSAMKDSTAYMVTDMLRDVLTEPNGTGELANIRGLDLAGKTGTTNYPSDFKQKNNLNPESVPDAWFAGYTTDYTIAVWGGNQKPSDPIIGFDGGRDMPKVLFRKVMSQISSFENTAEFKQPSSVEEASIIVGTEPLRLANNSTPRNLRRNELFVRGTLPGSTFVPKKSDGEVKNKVKDEVKDESLALEAPTDLSAKYDADNARIQLSWNHNKPGADDFDDNVLFDVSVSLDGSSDQSLTQTGNDNYTYGNVEPGHTYTFKVIAKAGSLVSPPASTTLMIQAVEEERKEKPKEEPEEEPQEEPEEELQEEPEEDDQNNGNNDNNNGNNGNNNNSNDGNNDNNNGSDENGTEGDVNSDDSSDDGASTNSSKNSKPNDSSKPSETKPGDSSKPSETKPDDPSKPSETKPDDSSKPSETKPDDKTVSEDN